MDVAVPGPNALPDARTPGTMRPPARRMGVFNEVPRR
jgi:hypothetical protein